MRGTPSLNTVVRPDACQFFTTRESQCAGEAGDSFSQGRRTSLKLVVVGMAAYRELKRRLSCRQTLRHRHHVAESHEEPSPGMSEERAIPWVPGEGSDEEQTHVVIEAKRPASGVVGGAAGGFSTSTTHLICASGRCALNPGNRFAHPWARFPQAFSLNGLNSFGGFCNSLSDLAFPGWGAGRETRARKPMLRRR